MIVYNITIKINPAIEAEWIQWQKQEHIPDVMATGLFAEFKFFRLLDQDQKDGITYTIQYFTSSKENYNHYIENFAEKLRQKAVEKWGDRFIAFRTIMEAVQ
jgi:hypothetical protein